MKSDGVRAEEMNRELQLKLMDGVRCPTDFSPHTPDTTGVLSLEHL